MTPYLSIIITGRNDNYGGDFIKRLQHCIDWNTNLLEKYKIETEWILVNWNPVEENEALEHQIIWPDKRLFVRFRIITVPCSIHKAYSDPTVRKVLPLYEYLAKNTGIRRAKGEYVLSMNPDILMGEGLIKQLAKRHLKASYYYRANRIDFKNNDIKQRVKIWLKGFTYPAKKNFFLTNLSNKLRCTWYKNSMRFDSFFNRMSWNVHYHNAEYKFHCNVSGDFMLMHKDQWHKLRGNPESTYLALHTDALMVVMAATSGLKEKIFHAPIYHQEHTRRFDATEMGNEENRKAYLYFQDEAQKMINKKEPIIYNTNDWGLVDYELSEESH